MARPNKYDTVMKLVSFRIPEQMLKELKHICIERNTSLQDLLMQITIRYIAEEKKYEPKSGQDKR